MLERLTHDLYQFALQPLSVLHVVTVAFLAVQSQSRRAVRVSSA